MWRNPQNAERPELHLRKKPVVATARITLLLWTGPCRIRRNRTSSGASPPAGPAYRRVVAQEQKAYSRGTLRIVTEVRGPAQLASRRSRRECRLADIQASATSCLLDDR